jgi:hypothetical protein
LLKLRKKRGAKTPLMANCTKKEIKNKEKKNEKKKTNRKGKKMKCII